MASDKDRKMTEDKTMIITNIYWALTVVTHCTKNFTCINLFNPHNSPQR